MAQTFSDFKNNFYGRFNDLTVFDCYDFNLIKTVLDGLRVNYASRSKISLFIFYPSIIVKFIFFLKRFQARLKKNISLKSIEGQIKNKGNKQNAIIDSCVSNTYVNIDGKYLPRYFNYVIESLGSENLAFFQDQLPSDGIFFDLNFRDFENTVHFKGLTPADFFLLDQLKGTLKNITKEHSLTKEELYNVKVAIQLFFFQFRLYHYIFSKTPIKTVFFNMHYHREGGLYALKKLKIKTIELQHGLIAQEDIFYVFPKNILPVRHKSLFPDMILTFGDYWSNILKRGYEFQPAQIITAGYSIFEYNRDLTVINEIQKLVNGKKVILITTQTSFHQFFSEYAIKLSKQIADELDNYVIFVKPHPSEKLSNYKELVNRKGIEIVNYPLEYLFKCSAINISVYSTTLYDAVRYGVKSFALLKPGCEDYVMSVVNSGVAELLHLDDNPLKKRNETGNIEANLYYDKFNHSIIKNLVADNGI